MLLMKVNGCKYQEFLKLVAAAQTKATNQFVNPEHPLVVQYADAVNLIKQRMVSIEMHLLYSGSNWETPDESVFENVIALNRWSVERITQFEAENRLLLPAELKVYLMEIGERGSAYFYRDGLCMPATAAELSIIKQPFPITPDKIHRIENAWTDAWIDIDDKGWIGQGGFKSRVQLEKLFGLPYNYTVYNGCMMLGYSVAHDALCLIMNGVFEGEVWVDTLSYGAEVGGCFCAASTKRLKLLAFMAACLLAKEQNYTNLENKNSEWM